MAKHYDPGNEELRDVIREYGLTRREAGEMMMVLKTTVDRYLSPKRLKSRDEPNPTYRHMPSFRLKLLLTELRGRKKVMP